MGAVEVSATLRLRYTLYCSEHSFSGLTESHDKQTGIIGQVEESDTGTRLDRPIDDIDESELVLLIRSNRQWMERFENPCPDLHMDRSDIGRRLLRSLYLWIGLGRPDPTFGRIQGPRHEWVPVFEEWILSLVSDSLFISPKDHVQAPATGTQNRNAKSGCAADPCLISSVNNVEVLAIEEHPWFQLVSYRTTDGNPPHPDSDAVRSGIVISGLDETAVVFSRTDPHAVLSPLLEQLIDQSLDGSQSSHSP